MLENALGNFYLQSSSSLISPRQSLKFNFKVYNKIIEVFYPDLEFGANTYFKGVLDSNPKKFVLTFKSPDIRMESYFASKVEIKFDNNNPIFNLIVFPALPTLRFHITGPIEVWQLIPTRANDSRFFSRASLIARVLAE